MFCQGGGILPYFNAVIGGKGEIHYPSPTRSHRFKHGERLPPDCIGQVMDTLNNFYKRLDNILIHEMPSLYKVGINK